MQVSQLSCPRPSYDGLEPILPITKLPYQLEWPGYPAVNDFPPAVRGLRFYRRQVLTARQWTNELVSRQTRTLFHDRAARFNWQGGRTSRRSRRTESAGQDNAARGVA